MTEGMRKALESCPPKGRDWHEANTAVRRAIGYACGAGAPLETAAEAAIDAAVTMLAEVIGERAAADLARVWIVEYEALVGPGAFGLPLDDGSDQGEGDE